MIVARRNLPVPSRTFPAGKLIPCGKRSRTLHPEIVSCLCIYGRFASTAADMLAWLERAAEEAETDAAKKRIVEELRKLLGGGEKEADDPAKEIVKVPVVRLKIGEVAEVTSVMVLPVCEANEGEIVEAPDCGAQGKFDVWSQRKGGVARVGAFDDYGTFYIGCVICRCKGLAMEGEADRGMKEVGMDDGFYMVCGENGTLAVERGVILKEKGGE
ncbi:rubisco accumulation factor 1.1, chloroplastic-like [Aristolochia californica]|uniref:rubisco accumulation factor 1.1, chloroplastic-like n=1 Tax=Aristolochia californica TaxID=171875 RepID=UPI0035DBE376